MVVYPQRYGIVDHGFNVGNDKDGFPQVNVVTTPASDFGGARYDMRVGTETRLISFEAVRLALLICKHNHINLLPISVDDNRGWRDVVRTKVR